LVPRSLKALSAWLRSLARLFMPRRGFLVG